MLPFVNREAELHRLHELYDSDRPELAVVFGRRRMGKTRLVLESIIEYDTAVYHQAAHGTAEQQLEAFIHDTAETFPGITRIRRDWEQLLGYLAEQNAIVIIDEFPYLVAETNELPSLIQRIWDHEVEGTATTFVLTGSAIGMMHEVAIDGSAPLFGRLSKQPNGKLNIGPLPFADAMTFFPTYDPVDQVLAYGIFGGTPEYLRAIDNSQSLKENVTTTLLQRAGSLHEEPEDVLYREVKEVNRYFAVLKAMAEGNRQVNEIAQAAGIAHGSSGYYLDRLKELRIITRSYPVTVDPARSRKGRYHICDPLFRFWFRFVYGRTARYEVYGPDGYGDLIAPELPDFVSPTFEELCQRSVLYTYGETYNFTEEPGTWWDGNGHEIDIVAPTGGETLLAGEAKFQRQPLSYDVLAQLEQEAPLVDWSPSNGGSRTYEYALFSRSGFTSSVQEAADDRTDLRLFSVEDVVNTLSG